MIFVLWAKIWIFAGVLRFAIVFYRYFEIKVCINAHEEREKERKRKRGKESKNEEFLCDHKFLSINAILQVDYVICAANGFSSSSWMCVCVEKRSVPYSMEQTYTY